MDDTNPTCIRNAIGETTYREWLELDRLLTHLCESQSIQFTLLYDVPYAVDEQDARVWMESLFPEATARGIVDLVARSDWI
jgi:hypothetical protein